MTSTTAYKKLKHHNTPGHAHELTFSCYRRQDYLCDDLACEFFLNELKSARDRHQFRLWAYVLMPNHIHLLLWPLQSSYDIATILQDIKGPMARRYREHLFTTEPARAEQFIVSDKSKKREVFRFWQPGGGFDRNLYNPKPVHQAIAYTEANPVRKGFAPEPALYRWSSAYARETGTGLIPDTFNMPVNMPDPRYQRVGVL